ncbi:interleukin-21 receptor [Alosa pseudoharengus]|uniref:interleukin-21 receptor n=1 Tax=Alosa pseudoharengus TaxID=34774 RepID=UPI003F8974C8
MGTLLCFLLLMTWLDSGLGQPGLECYNDLIDNITCKLKGTDQLMEPQSECILTAVETESDSHAIEAECVLKKPGGNFTECVLHIPFIGYFVAVITYDLEASCKNKAVASLKGYDPYYQMVKMPPPRMPTIENTTISWTLCRTSLFEGKGRTEIVDYKSELQYRTDRQRWKDVKSITIQKETRRHLQEELKKGQRYHARVRVRPTYDENISTWSDWSPVASWDTPADLTEDLETWLIWWATIGALAVIVFLVVIMFMGARKIKPSFIPDPAKYFDGLHSVHKGNFKTWLGSFQAVDILSVEQQYEYTSPVEVLKGQTSSSFSNIQYFYGSQEIIKIPPHPYPDNLEPCPEFSPYDDMKADRGSSTVDNADMSNKRNNSAGLTGSGSSGRTNVDLGPLQMSSSYKDLSRLREEAQSPDSGVSVGSMDEESHEESLESSYEQDERAPLAHCGGTFNLQKAPSSLHTSLKTDWSLPRTPLPPLPPLHCTVPFIGPDQCSTPTGQIQPLGGLYGELEPSSDDYMPLKT